MTLRRTLTLVVVVTLCATLAGTVLAADVSKKWRISFAAGGYNPQDEVRSASANVLTTVDPCLRTNTCTTPDLLSGIFIDPRNDSSVFNNLDINAGFVGTLAVQYGFAKTGMATFLFEGSIGYGKSDVGDIEVQAQFVGNGVPEDLQDELQFNFLPFKVAAGELERVPIQLSVIARFRPRATLNPYFGLGLGYSIIGFDVDPALNELSTNMDASRGLQMRLQNSFATQGNPTTVTDGLPQLDLSGATIDARDTFEWHLAGGVELTVGKRVSVFFDLRWIDASRSLSIGFNGSDELGKSVPQFLDFDDTVLAKTRYGPALIGSCPITADGAVCSGGGLLDVGQVIVTESDTAPSSLDCSVDPQNQQCEILFVFKKDFEMLGVEDDFQLDPGQYYAQGGSIDYDGFTAQFGVRITF